MTFKPGKVYKHLNSTDIHYYVATEPQYDDKSVQFITRYWNNKSKIFQGEAELARIKKEDLANWSEVE